MSMAFRLLLITFLESFSCVLVERGIYFFCHDWLGFSNTLNLWLALAFGVAYVVGALCSHGLSIRLTEKALVIGAIGAQAAFHGVLTAWPTTAMVFAASTALGWLNGAKWPVVESYVSAGQPPAGTARVIGRFNVSWALAVPLSLVIAGPMIQWQRTSLFILAGVLNLASLWFLRRVETRPVHLPEDHPERPTFQAGVRLRSLLAFSRWAMFSSYASLWVLAAMMPGIFQKGFGFSARMASPLSSIVDFVRLGAFVVLQGTVSWHNRWGPLVGALVSLPAGFVLVLFSGQLGKAVAGLLGAGAHSAGPFAAGLALVISGEALFGLAAGVVYYGALYYAMVVKNASVDAGGVHESLIGMGFAVGPLAALVGMRLAPLLGGNQNWGVLAGVAPLFFACACGGAVMALRISRGGQPLSKLR